MNPYTGIRAQPGPHLYLGSGGIHRMPFLSVTTDRAFEMTPLERENLGRYLRNGGFVFADNGTPNWENGAAEASLRQMFRDVLGCHARFEPIPASHPLYHCFFDFDNPLQAGDITIQKVETTGMCGSTAPSNIMPPSVFFLEGIWLDGRLVAVYSDKGYSGKWTLLNNNEPHLKFGVNLVVYALTQEGGMTKNNMNRFTDIQ